MLDDRCAEVSHNESDVEVKVVGIHKLTMWTHIGDTETAIT